MVMFCDLVGSTELSERHDPERYGLLIGRYVGEVRATLEQRYGGQVVGVQGDGLLALFGAPAAHGDDAERAVRAALEVVDVVQALSLGTQREWGETLAVRIAIHRGQIYRDVDSVYGLTTNVTARLQGLAPPGGIEISTDVLRMIGDCNIRNYSIYLRTLDDGQQYLFSYFEYVGSDFAADTAKMAADPTTQKWWALCMPCQKPLENRGEGEWWASMEEVFHAD